MALVDQQNIVNAIYTKINNSIGSGAPHNQCGVYELEAPQDTNLPLCIFSIVTDNVQAGLSCDRQEIVLQVNFYGWKKDGSKVLREISDNLWADLHRSSVSILGGASNSIVGTVKAVTSVTEDIIENRQEYKIIIV